MKTMLNLPEDIPDEAMKATGIKSKTKVIMVALEILIRKSKISELIEHKSRLDLKMDLDVVREHQCRYKSMPQACRLLTI